jgi:hypothetical protein
LRLQRLPDIIVSDRDVKFISELWTELMRIFKTKLEMSADFNPQTSVQAEMANSIIERYMREYAAIRQGLCDKLLPRAEFTVNFTRQQSIKMRLFEADIGYMRQMPLDTIAAGRSTQS